MNWFRKLLLKLQNPPVLPPVMPSDVEAFNEFDPLDYDHDLLIAELSRDEGRKRFPYWDSVGKFTIGVGRNLDDVGLSGDEIDLLLSNDIRRAEEDLDRLFPLWRDSLTERRKRALINFVFNLGATRSKGFVKMWIAIKAGDYDEASRQMLDSKWSKQVGSRSQRLADMIWQG